MPPEVLSVTTTTAPGINNSNNNSNNNKLTVMSNMKSASTTAVNNAAAMSNARMSSVSPSLSMNGSSNEATNVHGLYGPMSPQSSDSGHSMSDTMPSHLKFGGSFNGSGGYDPPPNMTKAQAAHHKELFTQRKQREFTPDNKKDDSYWDRRRRNNEAAKRSREKRRYNDMVLEQRVVELTKENHVLKAQLDAIREKFNISGENLVSVEQILASLPTSEQVLSITKRAKLTSSNGFANVSPGSIYAPGTGNGTVAAGTVAQTHVGAIPLAAQQKGNQSIGQGAPNGVSSGVAGGIVIPNEAITQQVQQPQQQQQQQQSHVIKSIGHVGGHLATPLAGHPHSLSPVAHQHLGNHGSPHHHLPAQQQPQVQPQSQPQLQSQHSVQHPAVGPHYVAEGFTTELLTRPNSAGHVVTSLSNAVSTSSTVGSVPPTTQSPPTLANLHVLQALNGNVACDDLDSLRKVVAAAAVAGELPPSVSALYAGPGQAGLPLHHHFAAQTPAGVYSPSMDVKYLQSSPEPAVSSSGVDAVSSSSPGAASVLNLSRRGCTTPTYEHMLSSTTSSSRLSSSLSSSGSSSGAVSGDDEHEHDAADDADHPHAHPHTHAHHHRHHRHHHHHHHHVIASNGNVGSGVNVAVNGGINGGGNSGGSSSSSSNSPSSIDSNNCLPLKLRHKSHLGDKDAAATALLALQHIKQEPVNHRSSPPAWTDGGDNSSDERDSGISIASADWITQCKRKVLAPKVLENCAGVAPVADVESLERDHSLKSKLARLESEMATIKNMMILSTDQNSVAPDMKI